MKSKLHLAALLLWCAFLAACGTPGAPRPPSLELPRAVADLAATRQGDKVTLTWTEPRETTDKQNVRHPGPVRICRGVNTTAMVQCPQVAELPAESAVASRKEKPEQRSYTDTLPAELQQQNLTGFATYAVESLNARGRSAGLSNHVEVPLAPTLAPPEKVVGSVTAQGPVIGWPVTLNQVNLIMLPRAAKQNSPAAYDYRLYRRDKQPSKVMPVAIPIENAFASPLLAQPNENVLDPTAEWEHTYLYWVTVVTTVDVRGGPQEVEGAASPVVEVFVHDIFAPAAPAGLQAVASGVGQPPFVDLTWAPNTEADLAGYNLYRHQAGQQPVKINAELVKAPAYRDREVTAGHNYFYAVTAVDLRGNESPRSEEASESVP